MKNRYLALTALAITIATMGCSNDEENSVSINNVSANQTITVSESKIEVEENTGLSDTKWEEIAERERRFATAHADTLVWTGNEPTATPVENEVTEPVQEVAEVTEPTPTVAPTTEPVAEPVVAETTTPVVTEPTPVATTTRTDGIYFSNLGVYHYPCGTTSNGITLYASEGHDWPPYVYDAIAACCTPGMTQYQMMDAIATYAHQIGEYCVGYKTTYAVLVEHKGDCQGFTNTIQSMSNAVGIPCDFVSCIKC